jgi:hypothetical protein
MHKSVSNLEDELGRVKEAISHFQSGDRRNVAIISEPCYDEKFFIDAVEKLAATDCLRMKAESLAHDNPLYGSFAYGIPEKSILIVEGVHRLYRRKIGGFAEMQSFLEAVSSSLKLFITSWNAYSWDYLSWVLPVAQAFPVQVELPRWSASQIQEWLMAPFREDELEFVVEEKPKETERWPFRLARREVNLWPLGRRLNLPTPEIEVHQLKELVPYLKKRAEPPPSKDLFFQRLTGISGGNPGVAETLWKRALQYPKVRSDLLEESSFVGLDYHSSYTLCVILSMGQMTRKELAPVVGPVEETLYLLKRQGLISLTDDICSIRPEAMKRVVDHLKRVRMVR